MTEVVRTERLLLRPLRADDAEAIYAQIADWEVMRWLSQPPWPYTLQDAIDFIQSCPARDPTNTTFAITRMDTLIGAIDARMNPTGRSQRGPGPNLGYWLARRHWGNGYMTEAAAAFIAQVFAAGIGDTIYSGAFKDNHASLRVQEKLGFVRDGETMLYALPRRNEFLHVNTKLVRSVFEAVGP